MFVIIDENMIIPLDLVVWYTLAKEKINYRIWSKIQSYKQKNKMY